MIGRLGARALVLAFLVAVGVPFVASAAAPSAGAVRAAPVDPCQPDVHKPKATLQTPARFAVQPGEVPSAVGILDLAPRPTPIDIFFVMDSSPSMDPAFDSLKESITEAGDELRATGIDIWAGVADFSDLNNRPYRLMVPLGPLTCTLADGVARIRTGGGGQEPHRVAMDQAISGRGSRVLRIPPGRGAAWRPNTLRLLFQVSDTGIDEDLDFSPSHEQLVGTFLDRSVHHVGIHVVDASISLSGRNIGIGAEENAGRAQPDMQALSRDTRTLAPEGGLDCNGDGIPELLAGAPVVCPFWKDVQNASMGKIVQQVVRTLRTTTGVELAVVDSSGLKVVVDNPVRHVDVSERASLAYWFAIECPAELLGKEVPLKLAGRIAGVTVAESTTMVTCVPPPPAAATIRPQPALAVAQVPAPAAVAPSSALQGAGQAFQGVTAQAPAQAPMVGMAAAPQDELQLAHARARSGSGDDGGPTRAAAAVMTLGAVAALRRRPSPAWNRRRR